MNLKFRLYSATILSVLLTISVNVSGQKKKNLGFETGSLDGWTGYTWFYRNRGIPVPFSTPPVLGYDYYRHALMTDVNGYDPNTGNQLKLIPPGYKFSVRLGSSVPQSQVPGGPAYKGGQQQTLSYKIKVDESNAFLLWKFAVVLEDPYDITSSNPHKYNEEPRFKITLLDEENKQIKDCSNYDVYVSDAKIGGFKVYNPPGLPYPVYWRNWTTVGADLTKYIGKTVTIEFFSAGCTGTAHYGYGYFVLDCLPLYITVDYCRNAKTATLIGPEGFEKYEWFDKKNVSAGVGQTINLTEPEEGDTYTCNLTSATGCKVSLNTTIARYWPNAKFSNSLVDCNDADNKLYFYLQNKPTNGTLEYNWKFPDGETSEAQNPVHSFKSVSGWNPVTLIVNNPPSACADTFTTMVESFNPPLVKMTGFKTYCPGLTTVLQGYGADHYKWLYNNVEYKGNSIEIGAPGGTLLLTGYTSNEECQTVKTISVFEEPDWPISIDYNPVLCKGDTIKLQATGSAISYLWNTQEQTSFIRISKPGTFSVTGTNPRGCKKSASALVTGDELPLADFELDKHVVDKRHNLIHGSIKQEDLVSYTWDMGEGSVLRGNNISHSYQINSSDLIFKVKLTSVNENNCTSSTIQEIIVDVFIPNVFTPNNDGTNDFFMAGYEIQVFDRNGKILYHGKTGWDGTYNGRAMSPDTYFYTLQYADYKNELHKKQGYITLVR